MTPDLKSINQSINQSFNPNTIIHTNSNLLSS